MITRGVETNNIGDTPCKKCRFSFKNGIIGVKNTSFLWFSKVSTVDSHLAKYGPCEDYPKAQPDLLECFGKHQFEMWD